MRSRRSGPEEVRTQAQRTGRVKMGQGLEGHSPNQGTRGAPGAGEAGRTLPLAPIPDLRLRPPAWEGREIPVLRPPVCAVLLERPPDTPEGAGGGGAGEMTASWGDRTHTAGGAGVCGRSLQASGLAVTLQIPPGSARGSEALRLPPLALPPVSSGGRTHEPTGPQAQGRRQGALGVRVGGSDCKSRRGRGGVRAPAVSQGACAGPHFFLEVGLGASSWP